jgi:hypothetical protein
MLKKEIEEDGNITYVHLSAELILWKWLLYWKQLTDSMQSPQNFNVIVLQK